MLQQYTKEFKYNLTLAVPVIMGMLGHTFVQLADNIMVGQLGTAELAAVSLGNSFVFVAMSLGIGFSTAITPLVAEADAAGKKEDGKSALKHGLLLCTILGLLLFGVIMLAKPVMYLMKQPPEVVELALPYLDLVALSLVPLIIFQAFKQFSEGLSQTKYPMYATIIANVVNITLNYLLIFGNLGFPKMGIVGAAIGTLASRVIMVLFIWLLLRSKKKFHDYVTGFNFAKLEDKVMSKIINLGFPSALQMFFEVGIFTSAVWLSGVLGKNHQAANQIALNLSSMTFMVGMGLGVAAMIRVGNQKGLSDFKSLRRIAISIFFLTFLLEIVFAAIFFIFNQWLPTIYLNVDDVANQVDNMEVISIAAQLLVVAAIFQISDGLQVVILGALRGLQDVKVPTFITFVAYWMIGFPTSYYLSLYTELKSTGIWIGLLAGLTASAILLYIRFNTQTKKKIAAV
ncbi:MATE family efflux transporter [Cellulophaga sp. HaHa_2_95]|uniref:MATE family efflux transporter n=1 Tax=Cellulophaga TaxID=104264 RepID=UPI00051D6D7A|nr:MULTISPECIES: MATE family efflux transporter [Cellulophaga]KGK30714.1 multidrug transporter [Cellulophaga sp. E6(2014)]MCR1026905.1 MATE family efflux transporter [Cellulophaga baltica]QXP52090.1 MATE family efflux transporter [Cellulophaga sp. HaHa_2_1]QXP55586.1 MATE family efflux transporter [Cellulophaga sp. HaHa_2_95]